MNYLLSFLCVFRYNEHLEVPPNCLQTDNLAVTLQKIFFLSLIYSFPCFMSFTWLFFDDDEFDRLVVIASDRPSVFLVDQYTRLDSPAALKRHHKV